MLAALRLAAGAAVSRETLIPILYGRTDDLPASYISAPGNAANRLRRRGHDVRYRKGAGYFLPLGRVGQA